MNERPPMMTNDLISTTEVEAGSLFKAIFEHSTVGIVTLDSLGFILDANGGFCRMLGYPLQQLRGLSYWVLTVGVVDIPGLNDNDTGRQQYRCVDGSFLDCIVAVTSLRDSHQTVGHVLLVQELSREPAAKTESGLQCRELEALMDTLPMPVFFKSIDLQYQRANRAACEFLGLTPLQIIGRSDAELFPAALANQIRQQDEQAIRSQALLISEDTPLADARGNLHYFSIYKSPVKDDSGRMIGLLDLALDVTERKLAESERLTQLQGQRDALVQEVHHRIKNHLQGVVGLLQRAITGNPMLSQSLRGVLAQIESIAGIHGLQSRLGSECLKFGQVAAMIAELTPNRVSVGGNGMEAQLPHQEAVPFALTLNELVSNAFKHRNTEAGNRLVYLNLALQGENLHIQVRTGPATLPAGFDFAAGLGLGTGLRLLRTLLPSQGAALRYFQDRDEVVAELQLMPPLVIVESLG